MPRGHRRGHAACPDGLARRGGRPRTHGVQEGEVNAPVVAVARGRVPRVGVVRGELNPACSAIAATRATQGSDAARPVRSVVSNRGTCGCENPRHLGRCFADRGWLGPAFWGRAGRSGSVRRWDDLRPVGLKLMFLIVSRAVPVLGLSRRESWWKDAGILML